MKDNETYFDELKKVVEPLGWHLTLLNDNDVEIGNYSPAGEDITFSLSGDSSYAKQIIDYAEDFDEDEHVKMWINSGASGVPSIKELVEDAEEIQKMLNELADAVRPLL